MRSFTFVSHCHVFAEFDRRIIITVKRNILSSYELIIDNSTESVELFMLFSCRSLMLSFRRLC